METSTPRDSSDVHSWESILEIPTKARKSLQAALRFAPPELVRDSPLVEELRSIPQLQMSLRLRFESDTLREIVQRSRVCAVPVSTTITHSSTGVNRRFGNDGSSSEVRGC